MHVEKLQDAADFKMAAVIDIGSTAIRMAVAEFAPSGRMRILETVKQTVAIGRDTFTRGEISRATTEEAVKAIRHFKQLASEYQLDPGNIRAVATSAVREASNRETFLDRIFIATGIPVSVVDQAEVSRLIYLAVRADLVADENFRKRDTLVIEVGGGNTEILMFRQGKVGNSHVYSIGAMRLRKELDEFNGPAKRLVDILHGQIDKAARHILSGIRPVKSPRILCLGGDARYACAKLNPDGMQGRISSMKTADLETLTNTLVKKPVDDLVRQYGMSYPDAETIGPALLIYLSLAKALKQKHLLVGQATLRDGLLTEMTTGGHWSSEFKRQVINSSLEIAKKYKVDITQAKRVARYSEKLFDALKDEHGLDEHYGLILSVAALLHQCGHYVSGRAHHKHSMYLIMNSDIFGLGSNEVRLAALTARYHRRSLPSPTHDEFTELSREERLIVAKLAAILRVAIALTLGSQSPRFSISVTVDSGTVVIHTESDGDLLFQRHRLSERDEMFEQVYGMAWTLSCRKKRGKRAFAGKRQIYQQGTGLAGI